MSREHMLSVPNPSAYSQAPEVALKLIIKINAALKKCYGHDHSGDDYVREIKRKEEQESY